VVGPLTPHLQPALDRALVALAQHLGTSPAAWTWGRLHRVPIESPLSRLPLVGSLWSARTLPLGGDGFTVNQADVPPTFPPQPVGVIASCRMVVDVGSWDNSRTVLPGGQSGHPASEHYQDNIDDWHEGRYHPMVFSRDAVERVGTNYLTLQPLAGDGVEE
jgi:penicillin G amidase